MKNKILKGQYFYYTIGSYSDKRYYSLEALKDIDHEVCENSKKILQLVIKLLNPDGVCCQDKSWLFRKCDNCQVRNSSLLFLAVLDVQGLVSFVSTYGEINYDDYNGDVEDAVDIDFDVNALRYTGGYEKVITIVSKIINEDLKGLTNG